MNYAKVPSIKHQETVRKTNEWRSNRNQKLNKFFEKLSPELQYEWDKFEKETDPRVTPENLKIKFFDKHYE